MSGTARADALGNPASTPSDVLRRGLADAAGRFGLALGAGVDWLTTKDGHMVSMAVGLAEAQAALECATDAWRTDMENAPHDEPLLVYGNWEGEISYKSKGPAWCVASSANGTYWSAVNADYYSVCCIDATRWMPLPSNKAAGSSTSSPDGEAGGTTPSGGNNT